MNKTKAPISALWDDAEFEKLIEGTKAPEKSNEQTDPDTIPSKGKQELLL